MATIYNIPLRGGFQSVFPYILPLGCISFIYVFPFILPLGYIMYTFRAEREKNYLRRVNTCMSCRISGP